MAKIDITDLKLLSEMERNSRQTFSQIGKKLKTSQQVINYRIDSLKKRNILQGFYTIINFTLLGYTNYRTMIRLTNLSKQKHHEIINYLKKHSNVLWVVECGGRWDLIVNFMAKSIGQYDFFLKKFRNKFPKQIQNYDILTTVKINYFGRDYFSNQKRKLTSSQEIKEKEKIKVDKTNLQILNLISENARINSVEIANKLKISPNTILLRIKNMERTGLIQGYKPLIHMEHTPFSSYKSLIKFQNITEQKEEEIITYLKQNVHVIGAIKLIGQWDFEIEFEVESKEKMLKLTRGFRDRFSEVIKEFEVLPLFHEYKYNFFPRDLIKSKEQKIKTPGKPGEKENKK